MSILDGNNQTGDKRTLIAVVLSVVVITGGFLLQAKLFPSAPARVAQSAQPAQSATGSEKALPAPAPAVAYTPAAASAKAIAALPSDGPATERNYTISTDLIEAVLSNRGGDIVSLKLKKHSDKDGAVDLIVPGRDGAQGLSLAFGDSGAAPVSDLMNAMMLDNSTIEFSRTFFASVPGKAAPVPFTLKKTYTFRDGEYMFGLAIGLENSVNEILSLDTAGMAYSLTLGPQIGPRLSAMPGSNNTDYRKFVRLVEGKKKEERPKAGVPFIVKDQPSWVGISGKYFSFVAVPEISSFKTTFFMNQDPKLFQTDSISIARPAINASKQVG